MPPAAWIFLLIVIALGFTLRVWNLGKLGLVADEGHQALGVAGILEQGFPRVPSGNVYLRGAPFLYTEALVAAVAGVNEGALRLPAALFGTLAILVTFLLGRRLFGLQVGLVAAALLAGSVWQLELSRYARMYTLLQLAFVAATFAFVRGYLDGRQPWRLAAWGLMLLCIVTHQLGVMILLLFLIPAFLDEEDLPAALHGWRRYRLLVPAALLGSFWIVFHRLVGHLMVRTATSIGGDEADPVAPGVLGIVEQHVRVPVTTMPLNLLGEDRAAVVWAAVLFVAAAVAIGVVGLRQPGRRLRAFWALAILAAAFMNLFAVVLGLVIFSLVLFQGGLRDLRHLPWSIALVGAAVFAAYWAVYLLGHPQALDPGWTEPWSIGQVFTAYPPFRSRVLRWFLEGWPRLTILVGAGLLVLIASFIADRRRTAALIAVSATLLPLVGATFGREVFNEVRYHFHLYPFILIVFAVVIAALARAITAAIDVALAFLRRPFRARRVVEALTIVALAMVCSSDVSPGELALLIRRDYTTAKDPVRATLNWRPYAFFHQDHVGPSQYVRDHLEPGDRVMFFGPTYWASIYRHYIGQVDYAVAEKATRIFRNDHVVHHVTGVRCITRGDELEQVLDAERGHRIWLLGDLYMLSEDAGYFTPEMKRRLRGLATPWHYLGHDLNTFVRRIDPQLDAHVDEVE